MKPPIAASRLGLFIRLQTGISSIKEIIKIIAPDDPKSESGLNKMIKIEKSIRHKWVKFLIKVVQDNS